MKCLFVKHSKLLIKLLIFLTIPASFSAWITFSSQDSLPALNANGMFQIGFYDLRSQEKEIYNSQIRLADKSLFTTVTTPHDKSFVFKGKFDQTLARRGKYFYTLSPIYSSISQGHKMIDEQIDLLMQTRFWMMPINNTPESLMVAQSGTILIYPPNQPDVSQTERYSSINQDILVP